MKDLHICIIGTGFAGYTTAKELRAINDSAKITIISQDDGCYYSKPQLSSALTNKKTADNLASFSAKEMEKQLNASILTFSRVVNIEPTSKEFFVESIADDDNLIEKKKIKYDKLVFACGANVNKPKIEGSTPNNTFSINNLINYREFRKALANKKHVTILGSGLIGCEFANDLLNTEMQVSIVSLDGYPLQALLPEEAGKALERTFSSHGVKWFWQTTIKKILEDEQGLEVFLTNGKSFKTNLLISAVGLKPNIELAMDTHLKTNHGIVVDQNLQASIDDIYAIGDCAEICGNSFQFILPIRHAAKTLAMNLNGQDKKLSLPGLAINVKTPICPIVVAPPPKNANGHWEIKSVANHVKATFIDAKNKVLGFALTGDHVRDKLQLTTLLPPIFTSSET